MAIQEFQTKQIDPLFYIVGILTAGEGRVTAERLRKLRTGIMSMAIGVGEKNTLWPQRLKELIRAIRRSPGDRSEQAAATEAWLLINSVLIRSIRIHGARLGRLSSEDREDLAAQKSLDLLQNLISGNWVIDGRASGEIAGYLSTIARNGVVDVLRERGRVVSLIEEMEMAEGKLAHAAGRPRQPMPPDALLAGKEYAGALRKCVSKLQTRSAKIWFFRVFCSLSSREIASHPEVQLKAPYVDVLLKRVRESLKQCMSHSGYKRQDMPPGTFVELWKMFYMDVPAGENQ